ncbi:MAG: TolC family outer membrane protein [Pseudomonadota bacterium]|nr:TolC family outer membrane protein [Pseudomonadota bacterium]
MSTRSWKIWSLAAGLLIAAVGVNAQSAAEPAAAPATEGAVTPLGDLLAVCNDALQANPAYRAARAQYRAAKELLPQASGKLLPQLGLRAQYDWIDESITGDYYGVVDYDNDDQFDRLFYGAQLTQALYRPELFADRKQAQLQITQAEHVLQAQQDVLLIQVAEAYFGLLAAQDAVAFSSAETQALAEQLEQVRIRVESGLVTDADLKGTTALHELALAREVEARNAVANAETRLEAITGRSYSAVKRLPLNVTLLAPEPADENVWIKRAESDNPGVLAQRLGVSVAGLEQHKADRLAWPKLDLVGLAYDLDAGGGATGERDEVQQQIGVVFNMPLYAGGQISATRRQAEAMNERAAAMLDDGISQIVRDTRIAYRNATAGLTRVNALKRGLDATIAYEAATRSGYEAGTLPSTDVLEAVERRFAAERDFAFARYQVLLSSLRLKLLAGNLLVADLAQINRILVDPAPSP